MPDGVPELDELAALVEARTADDPTPTARLLAAIGLGGELAGQGDELIGRFVTQARAQGLSWTAIGQAFGTSKQAVQQRFGGTIGEPSQWPRHWTVTARAALDQAGREAATLGHDYVGTEHALLALLTQDDGVAAEVLKELGVTRERVLATPCVSAGRYIGPVPDRRPLMPRLKEAFENSRRIADGLGASDVDTEHLLAGIVGVQGAMAVEILRRVGIPPKDVRVGLAMRLDLEPARLDVQRRRRRRLLSAR